MDCGRAALGFRPRGQQFFLRHTDYAHRFGAEIRGKPAQKYFIVYMIPKGIYKNMEIRNSWVYLAVTKNHFRIFLRFY